MKKILTLAFIFLNIILNAQQIETINNGDGAATIRGRLNTSLTRGNQRDTIVDISDNGDTINVIGVLLNNGYEISSGGSITGIYTPDSTEWFGQQDSLRFMVWDSQLNYYMWAYLTFDSAGVASVDLSGYATLVALNNYLLISSLTDSLDARLAGFTATGSDPRVPELSDSIKAVIVVNNTQASQISTLQSQLLALQGIVEDLGGNVPIALNSAEIGSFNDSIIVFIANRNFNQITVTAPDQFTVTQDGIDKTISSIYVQRDSLFVRLDTVATAGSEILVSYTVGTLTDSSGNYLPTFSDYVVTNNVASPSAGNIYIEDFSGLATADDLLDQVNWTGVQGQTYYLVGTGLRGDTSGYALGYYNQPMGVNQFAEDSINAASSTSGQGVAVLLDDSGNGYGYYLRSTIRYFVRFDAGVPTTIGAAASATNGEVRLRLEVSGNVFTCYKDGAVDIALSDGNGVYVDNTYTTGKAGIVTFGSGGRYITDWTGGDN